MDMLNEEGVRLVLKCVDKNRLEKNVQTGNLERDGEVFVSAARWVDHYGEKWVKHEGDFSALSILLISTYLSQILTGLKEDTRTVSDQLWFFDVLSVAGGFWSTILMLLLHSIQLISDR